MTVSVPERKARKTTALKEATHAAMVELRLYAQRHRGRFIVFGSAARGELRYDSDLDLLIDFPSPADRVAYLETESICHRHGLTPDLHYLADVSDRLLERIGEERIVLE